METAAWVAYLYDVARSDFTCTVKQQVTAMLDLCPGDIVLDPDAGLGTMHGRWRCWSAQMGM